MQLGSTAKNINVLSTVTALMALMGVFNLEMFTLGNVILTIVSYYVLVILGLFMTLHRYYSHKSFEFKYQWLHWVFTSIAILAGRGSPLGWVYIHRQHHAYSDTEKDPHSPKFVGYKLFGFGHYKKQEEEKMQIFIVKDLMSKEHLFIHKWYMAIVLSIVVLLALINIQLLYFAWIMPAFLVNLSQNNFNYFGHMNGYRNFATRDDSRNTVWLFPFLLGEAWHNNHHHDPKNYSSKHKKYEFDPMTVVIDLVKK